MYVALIFILFSFTSERFEFHVYVILCPEKIPPPPKFSHYITIGGGGGKLARSSMQARLLSMLLPALVVGSPVGSGQNYLKRY